ncbi:oxygen evolving enhancer protein 3 [Chloropicon primus]|uniref:Oxygen evolving enhancer protein 3 n=1 Tax=Chloropicon primus TaxID=1764295 RepID=A0A5B8MTS9_9CHLO|nr:oxygen evolving enhancer protein 3 [Chloropicon primus]UPR03180.1 oxygen evolving enhancer protein 3 [Chloropicon primus]|eukprot:QDZ23969.1 oxygen evolving enhancer protein 3 [Chloropicon primus]
MNVVARKNLAVCARHNNAKNARVVRVSAQAESSSRRQMMGQLAGVAALLAGAGSAKAESINLFDDKTKGLDYKNNIADQARDVGLDNNIRTGRSQSRADKALVVSRVTEGKNRLEKDVKDYVSKAYWYDAKQELRRQLGYMSGDMDTLIASTSDKKTGLSMKKDFFTAVDNLDFAIRKKDKDSGLKYQADAVAKLNDFISFAT